MELLVGIVIISILVGLTVSWGYQAKRRSQIQETQSVMGNLLVVADTLKSQYPTKPDHRLANFYWVDTNLADTAPSLATSRQMSSAELLAFLASNLASTNSQLEMVGPKHFWSSTINGVAPANQLVLVFERAPNFSDPVAKTTAIGTGANLSDPTSVGGGASSNYTSRPYQLVSPAGGWRLRTLCDAWGHEILYRYYTDATELNASANLTENIGGDEQPTPAVDYKALATIMPSGGSAPTVRPAIAAYGYPSFVSAGPDGKWGAFSDGTTRDATAVDRRAARSVTVAGAVNSDAIDNVYSQESENR